MIILQKQTATYYTNTQKRNKDFFRMQQNMARCKRTKNSNVKSVLILNNMGFHGAKIRSMTRWPSAVGKIF